MSYSKYAQALEPYYEQNHPGFGSLRMAARELLQKDSDLAEIVQLVGKSALGEPDKVTLEVAGIIKNDYLQQNGISDYDCFCPFYKTTGMLRNMVEYHNKAQAALSNNPEMTWSRMREHTNEILFRLTQQKFEDPKQGREEILKKYDQLTADMTESFRSLAD